MCLIEQNKHFWIMWIISQIKSGYLCFFGRLGEGRGEEEKSQLLTGEERSSTAIRERNFERKGLRVVE